MVSFVVLHYKNLDDTIECIKHLKKIIRKDDHIIIVDNNTLTNEEKKEISKYTRDIILLEENKGFAKANNIGVKYAYEKYNSNLYCVINNDVFIEQEKFVELIENDYNKYSYDMLGTKINSSSGESVNPFPVISGIENVEKEIKKCNKLIKIYNSSILYFMLNVYIKIKHIIKPAHLPKNGNTLVTNAPLHGCGIVFSKKYVEKYKDVFYDKTFLFHEEEFLYHRVLNDNLISVYDPEIIIFHKEGSSVKTSNKSTRKSKLFREQERLKSLKLLLKYMNEE